MAAYGAQLKLGKTPAQALAYVKTLITKHVGCGGPEREHRPMAHVHRQARVTCS